MEQIRLDIIPKGLMPVCHSSQYDKGRVIRLNLVDGLQGYTLTDETVTLNVRKPDNNIVTAGVTVEEGKSYVDIVTTEQMTACEGENLCEIVITKGDVKIASLNFKMKVEVDPLKDGIESETEIHNLETQIAEIDARIVPPIVAEEVANQYDSENVIFDDTPTASHGTGYTVTSEGIKNYVDNKPNALVDLTDVDIDNPTSNQALVWDTTEQKWVNGEVSTVGGLNDLNDVTIDDTSLEEGQELVYNNTAEVFENKTTRVELTQAEYDALANPLPDVDYYITDAPSMQGSSKDLSYDGGTDSVYDKIEGLNAGDVGYDSTATYGSGSVGKAIQGKATTGNSITFAPETGITAAATSAVINKTVLLNLTFTGSFTQNAWSKIGTMNVTPSTSTVYVAGVHSSDGLYAGMIQIRSDKGIYFYPKIAISGTVGCTANFNIT